ncbi:hypothetical protein PVAP13_9KG260613 [Panicum virgatum]|uniref:Uncharacterized protein n=1 Tax=Panicum virgatum TaxID=38727 RepID=A0A8T0NI70_PANVG|nr:hypothetical protein PVAP13_9KG260613 [Panicum virgatum]
MIHSAYIFFASSQLGEIAFSIWLVLYCSPPTFKWEGPFLSGNRFVLCTNLLHELIFRLTTRIYSTDIIVDYSIELVNMRDSLVPMFFELRSCSFLPFRCMFVVFICNVLSVPTRLISIA